MDGNGDSVNKILIDQFNTLLVYLGRPDVQRQLAVLALILFVVWLLPEAIRRWLHRSDRYGADDQAIAGWRRRTNSLYTLIGPVFGLILANVLALLFGSRDFPNGILESSRNFFWAWLAYRTLMLIFYNRFGQAFRPYQRWVFLPLFIIIIIYQITGSLIGFSLLADVRVLTINETNITLGKLILSLFILYWFIVASWVIRDMMERNLPSRIRGEPGTIQTIATLVGFFIIALGILASLNVLGFNLTTLAIVSGGLFVGIGLGLQDIVSNFISGIALMFEQSLRPGDVIELEGQLSTVQRLSIRATTVTTNDNIEIVVPNAAFTNQKVTTFTKSDRRIRLLLPFGVSYDSDPKEIREIAQETATKHELVLGDPAPELFFRAFGESSLDFELAIWIDRPELKPRISSDIYYMLWDALADAGIEIPFPQRDLNIGDGWEMLRPEEK